MRTRATPWGRDRGTWNSAPLSGSHDPPILGGVALVPALHAARGTHEGAFKLDNHSGMREIEESGCGTFLESESMPNTPPSKLFGMIPAAPSSA